MRPLPVRIFLIGALVVLTTTFIFSQDGAHKIVFQSLAWAPDGKSFAFTVIKVKPDWSDYAAEKWKLFIYHLENRQLQKLDDACLYFSYSPDGKRLAYDKSVDKNADIFLLDLETGQTSRLIGHEAKDRAPSWSPNGKSMVFFSDRNGHEELYTFNLKNGKVKQLTSRPEHKSYNPVWAPASNRIVYYLEMGDNKDQIYLTDRKGRFQNNLTQDNHHNVFPSWTPDGRIIYIRDQGQVIIMDANGENKNRLIQGTKGQVNMSPDGNFLLTTNDDNDLVRVEVRTKKETIILQSNEIFP